MSNQKPEKQRKLTSAAVAALWVLRHDHRTGGPPVRSARDLFAAIGYSTESSVRYGISILDRHQLATFAGYDARQKNIMVWAFNPDAEDRAAAIIAERHDELMAKVSAYRQAAL